MHLHPLYLLYLYALDSFVNFKLLSFHPIWFTEDNRILIIITRPHLLRKLQIHLSDQIFYEQNVQNGNRLMLSTFVPNAVCVSTVQCPQWIELWYLVPIFFMEWIFWAKFVYYIYLIGRLFWAPIRRFVAIERKSLRYEQIMRWFLRWNVI